MLLIGLLWIVWTFVESSVSQYHQIRHGPPPMFIRPYRPAWGPIVNTVPMRAQIPIHSQNFRGSTNSRFRQSPPIYSNPPAVPAQRPNRFQQQRRFPTNPFPGRSIYQRPLPQWNRQAFSQQNRIAPRPPTFSPPNVLRVLRGPTTFTKPLEIRPPHTYSLAYGHKPIYRPVSSRSFSPRYNKFPAYRTITPNPPVTPHAGPPSMRKSFNSLFKSPRRFSPFFKSVEQPYSSAYFRKPKIPMFVNLNFITTTTTTTTESPEDDSYNEISVDAPEMGRDLETELPDLDVAATLDIKDSSKLNGNFECLSNQRCRKVASCARSGGVSTSVSCGPLSGYYCCETGGDYIIRKSVVQSDPQCGWSREKTSRVVGGNDAEFGEYPWQVFIKIGEARCGGALLSRQHVVTAAHCVNGKSNNSIEVVVGDLVLDSMTEELPHERRRVQQLITHPKYKDLAIDAFDVAILILDKPVSYQDNIMPICLPEPDEDFTGVLATVSGWGRLSAENRMKPSHLQAVQLPIIQNSLCQKWLRSRGKYAPIKDDHLCAGYEQGGKDACRGDSGGPLAYQKKGRWYLAGIVSAGYSCSKPMLPGIYHRVSNTTEWISERVFSVLQATNDEQQLEESEKKEKDEEYEGENLHLFN